MVEFPISTGVVRINPLHVRALWQGNNVTTTAIIVGDDSLTYEVEMPIDEVEAKLKAEVSELGTLNQHVAALTLAVKGKV